MPNFIYSGETQMIKRVVVIGALLCPLVASAYLRCPSGNSNDFWLGTVQKDGTVKICLDGEKPCFTPKAFYEKCKYTHEKLTHMNPSLKQAIDDEVQQKKALSSWRKKNDEAFAQLEQASKAKAAEEARKKKEAEDNSFVNKSLDVSKKVFNSLFGG